MSLPRRDLGTKKSRCLRKAAFSYARVELDRKETHKEASHRRESRISRKHAHSRRESYAMQIPPRARDPEAVRGIQMPA